MIKPKLSKLVVLALMLLALYGCTTKNEVPQPVVDTQRVDALRTQLIALQQQVLGAQQTEANDSLSLAQLQAQITYLQGQLNKKVSYTVTVGSFLFQPLDGATVSLTQGGKIVTGKTASDGTTTFSGLYAGVITATVDLPSFARLVFRADIRNDWDNESTYSTGSTVLMLPLDGKTAQADSCMTTAYFKLYANYSILDDTLGGQAIWGSSYPSGSIYNQTTTPKATVGPNISDPTIKYPEGPVIDQTMIANLRSNSFENQNASGLSIPIGFTPSGGSGGVLSVSYENASWPATVNPSTGVYTLKLPATDVSNVGWGNEYPATANIIRFDLVFSEFAHDYTQYTDFSSPYITNKTNIVKPSFSETYVFRLGNSNWLSSQTTNATQATPWPYFYSSSLK